MTGEGCVKRPKQGDCGVCMGPEPYKLTRIYRVRCVMVLCYLTAHGLISQYGQISLSVCLNSVGRIEGLHNPTNPPTRMPHMWKDEPWLSSLGM